MKGLIEKRNRLLEMRLTNPVRIAVFAALLSNGPDELSFAFYGIQSRSITKWNPNFRESGEGIVKAMT